MSDSQQDNYYHASAHTSTRYPVLTDAITCDVCVIGGGLTGVSAALNLAEKGYDTVLLEAQQIGWGASGRNGGQVSGEPRHDQQDLEHHLGRILARQHWDLNLSALAYIKHCVQHYRIRCDWQETGIVALAHKARHARFYEQYANHLHRHYACDFVHFLDSKAAAQATSTKSYGGLVHDKSGHMHPLNFVSGLAQAAHLAGVRIFEKTPVTKYQEHSHHTHVTTEQGTIRTRLLVLACNGYLEHLEPRISGHMMPINNFIAVTQPLPDALAQGLITHNRAVYDSRFVVNYWRMVADNRLLFGGGEVYSKQFPKDIRALVRKPLTKIYPMLKHIPLDYAWGGTLAITRNRFPHLGRLGDRLYFAQGYSGHGVSMATFAGKLLAEAIRGDTQRFDCFAKLKVPAFVGGTLLRWPALVASMSWYALLDRL